MLLSPLTLPPPATRRHRPVAPAPRSRSVGRRPSVETASPVPRALIAWLTLGLGIVLLVPAARGDALLGASLPFWLIAAPLLNLAWWKRHAALAAIARRRRTRRARAHAMAIVRAASARNKPVAAK